MAKSTNRTNRVRPSTSRGQSSESESGMDNELHELFLDELADIHNAEQQLIKALPKMAKAAESDQLRQVIEMHLEETRQQISRLEQVAKSLNESIKRKTCHGMQGLLEEAEFDL